MLNYVNDELRFALCERWYEINSKFIWTPEKKQRIIELNNGLYDRYRAAYNELIRITNEYEDRYRSGDNNYKDYMIELEFWYNHPESQNKEENKLWQNMCEKSKYWGPNFCARSDERNKGFGLDPFEDVMVMWAKKITYLPFKVKDDKINLYSFMYDIFDNNHTYSLEDAMQMKAENFSWQLVIHLEHWGKSCQ